ncbi:UNVERIFIED_CONTAM: hypothetical protein HHA_450420 [Hammondia hammondi]|eukprot:XP_008889404.1 hypothetical protein HHA_450420 [Hammondia hammondi]
MDADCVSEATGRPAMWNQLLKSNPSDEWLDIPVNLAKKDNVSATRTQLPLSSGPSRGSGKVGRTVFWIP